MQPEKLIVRNEWQETYKYIERLETEELINIILNPCDVDEAIEAMIELISRDKTKALKLSQDILFDDEGDDHMQALYFRFLFSYYPYELLNVIFQRKKLDKALVGAIMDELTEQLPTANFIQTNEPFIRHLIELYEALTEQEKQFVDCDYPAFLSMVAEHGIT